jgi:hypothetical protein
MYFSPLPYHPVRLSPKYSPQHPILKHPLAVFLPQCGWPSFTPIQNKTTAQLQFCLDLYISVQHGGAIVQMACSGLMLILRVDMLHSWWSVALTAVNRNESSDEASVMMQHARAETSVHSRTQPSVTVPPRGGPAKHVWRHLNLPMCCPPRQGPCSTTLQLSQLNCLQ